MIKTAKPAPPNNSFPLFKLPVPLNEQERSYLGLSGSGQFRVGHIKPGIVIIEVFSFYCPFCQQAAPGVEQVYRKIEARPDLKARVTMIGIGMGDGAYEVRTFKEKFRVPFPLFSDEDMGIARLLKVKGTPTFIGVKVDGKGSEEIFYFEAGAFDSPARFLADIIEASDLKGGQK
ncbi:MAG TPA: TlpA disulfide reductase family protein [Syntrophorhabdaceae bacterium]